MVTKDNQIKLVDMGIAKKFVWESEVRCGTAGYIAPEILSKHRADNRADVFSCGVVLYYMLCGELPYTKQDRYESILAQNARCNISSENKTINFLTNSGRDVI